MSKAHRHGFLFADGIVVRPMFQFEEGCKRRGAARTPIGKGKAQHTRYVANELQRRSQQQRRRRRQKASRSGGTEAMAIRNTSADDDPKNDLTMTQWGLSQAEMSACHSLQMAFQ